MNCKIVQDLLPNYIEGLTTKETNKYIEDHLSNCKECSKIFEMMKSEIKNENSTKVETETKYLKKFNKKLKFFKIVLLIIILIFIFIIGRRMIILHDIQTKMSKYENADNFFIKTHYYNEDDMSIFEAYKKGNKFKEVSHHISLTINATLTRYSNGTTENLYVESGDSKIAELDREPLGITNIGGKMYENFGDFIKLAFTTQITSEKCNGIECYKLQTSDIIYNGAYTNAHTIDYVEKSTGLIIRTINDENVILNNDNSSGQVQDYRYEFGTVTDEEFKEPDITEYKVQENN